MPKTKFLFVNKFSQLCSASTAILATNKLYLKRDVTEN